MAGRTERRNDSADVAEARRGFESLDIQSATRIDVDVIAVKCEDVADPAVRVMRLG